MVPCKLLVIQGSIHPKSVGDALVFNTFARQEYLFSDKLPEVK